MFWAGFVVLAHILGALTSVRAILDVRTAQGAIAWAMALNLFPYVSVPAYWIFGQNRFHGYVSERREELLKTHPVAQDFAGKLKENGLLSTDGWGRAHLIEKLAKLPFTTGNDLDLLVNGEETFASIFKGIEAAKHYVLVEFYIIRDDMIGRELQVRLIAKAREGLRVWVLYDEIGSKHLSKEYQAELIAAGAEVLPFNTSQGRANRWQLNFRNHRKIVVVDGACAWVGGLNVGDEYMGRSQKFGPWRDTHVKLSGPAAQGVQMAFLEDWHWASGKILGLHWDPVAVATNAAREVLCLPSGPADPQETCTLFFLDLINSAERRLWIASPYFVPDEQFVSALQLAALRGVDVRVLLPDMADQTIVFLSGWSFAELLMKTGIQVYRSSPGFMHQKVMLVDDDRCTIGSANFDNRSFRLNFEITLAIRDHEFTSRVEHMLKNDFSHARLVTQEDIGARGFWLRFASRASHLLSPIQ